MMANQTAAADGTQASDQERLDADLLESFTKFLKGVKASLENATAAVSMPKLRPQLQDLTKSMQLSRQNQSRLQAEVIASIKEQMSKAIVVENIIPLLCQLMNKCLPTCLNRLTADEEFQSMLLYTLHLCHTCTDASSEFAAHLASSDEALKLVKALLEAWTQPHIDKLLDSDSVKCLQRCLTIVYNTLWQDEASGGCALQALRKLDIVDSVGQLFHMSADKDTAEFAFLILVLICTDDEAARLLYPCGTGQHQDRVRRLLRELMTEATEACQAVNRRSASGFQIMELLHCILRFSRRPDHRPLLISQGCLSLLKLLLESAAARPDDQVALALNTTLSLALHPVAVEEVRKNLGSGLTALEAGGNRWRDCRQLAAIRCLLGVGKLFPSDGIADFELFKLDSMPSRWTTDALTCPHRESGIYKAEEDGKSNAGTEVFGQLRPETSVHLAQKNFPTNDLATKTTTNNSVSAPDSPEAKVMISCSDKEADIELAKLVVNHLKKLRHQCCAPVLRSADPETAVNEDIKNCRALVMCVSREYEIYSMGEFEVRQAANLGKPLIALLCSKDYTPEAWLSFIATSSAQTPSTVERLDFSDPDRRTESLDSLSTLLNGQLRPSSPSIFRSNGSSGVLAIEHFTCWTTDQVSNWLKNRELPVDELRYLEGRHLKFLIDVKTEAPEAFYRMLREDLKLNNFLLVFQFTRALEELQN